MAERSKIVGELPAGSDPELEARFEAAEADAEREYTEARVNFRWRRDYLDIVKRAAAKHHIPYQTYLKETLLRAAKAELERGPEPGTMKDAQGRIVADGTAMLHPNFVVPGLSTLIAEVGKRGWVIMFERGTDFVFLHLYGDDPARTPDMVIPLDRAVFEANAAGLTTFVLAAIDIKLAVGATTA